jgi:hypothetical protein
LDGSPEFVSIGTIAHVELCSDTLLCQFSNTNIVNGATKTTFLLGSPAHPIGVG